MLVKMCSCCALKVFLGSFLTNISQLTREISFKNIPLLLMCMYIWKTNSVSHATYILQHSAFQYPWSMSPSSSKSMDDSPADTNVCLLIPFSSFFFFQYRRLNSWSHAHHAGACTAELNPWLHSCHAIYLELVSDFTGCGFSPASLPWTVISQAQAVGLIHLTDQL